MTTENHESNPAYRPFKPGGRQDPRHRPTADAIAAIFGDVMHAYTDDQAVEDGVLANIEPLGIWFQEQQVNRVTCIAYVELSELAAGRLTAPDTNIQPALTTMFVEMIRGAWFEGDTWHLANPSGGKAYRLMDNEAGGWTILRQEDC